MSRNDVERKIHFYRADCGRDSKNELIPFKPQLFLNHIKRLSFDATSGRYQSLYGNRYCCWTSGGSTKAEFGIIRQDAWPRIEENGSLKAITGAANAGLVEQIHVRFFPNSIVGFDFNFYGPRLERFGDYLSQFSDAAGAAPVVFEALLNHETMALLQDQKEVRLFSLRVRRSQVDRMAEIDAAMGSAFKETAKVSDADELEITLRPEPYSRDNLGKQLIDKARRLLKEPDAREITSQFKVRLAEPGQPASEIDLLGDRFIMERRILKQDTRTRVLDSADAFANIDEAYRQLKDELQHAGALAAGKV